MEIKDFLITPLILLLILILGYFIRPKVTDYNTRRYFFPGLGLKIIGAIALGIIYQFYYDGGDTFGYHTFGSRLIWDAFMDSPWAGVKLMFGSATKYHEGTYKFISAMWYFGDPPSYFVTRVAAFFDLLTFSTYSSTAVLFAGLSFAGMWTLFLTFYKYYPKQHLKIAIAIFFIPSVFFWGSGIMKDTLVLGAIGFLVFSFDQMIIGKNFSWRQVTILIFTFYVIFTIKVFVLFCLIPALSFWFVLSIRKKIKTSVVRYLIIPILGLIMLLTSFFGVQKLGEGNQRYSFENLLVTAEVTAKDNSLWTVRKEGSGYSLGDYDFSPSGLAQKFVPGVWVTLFRPYLWEVNSPVMLLSALESFFILIISINYFIRAFKAKTLKTTGQPILIFCLLFAISFAFAIGISSGNFGSLVRYKIVIMPFYLIFILLTSHSNRKGIKKFPYEIQQNNAFQ